VQDYIHRKNMSLFPLYHGIHPFDGSWTKETCTFGDACWSKDGRSIGFLETYESVACSWTEIFGFVATRAGFVTLLVVRPPRRLIRLGRC
jgi:hypothetical protein